MLDESDFHFNGRLENYDLWFADDPQGATTIDFDLNSELIELEDLFSYRGQNNVPEDYKPKYPQVTIFNDQDMRTTKSIYIKAKHSREYHLINKLHIQLSSKMEVQPDEQPLKFVERVLRDYNYYTQN